MVLREGTFGYLLWVACNKHIYTLFLHSWTNTQPILFPLYKVPSRNIYHCKFSQTNGDIYWNSITCEAVEQFNALTPIDHFSGGTAPLNSKFCISYTYSTNIGTEYFKHGIYCPFYSIQNAVCFIILTYLVPVLFTFYKQSVLNDAFYIFIQQI